jgi:hypothetical protein
MPLKEKINEFVISKKEMTEQIEEEYHDGTVYIDVVNQDFNMPYWFRQNHPFVWRDHYHLVSWNHDGSRLSFALSISGSAYRYEEHQTVGVSLKFKDAVHLMQQLKEAIDHIERVVIPLHKMEKESLDNDLSPGQTLKPKGEEE